ncbi:MAG: GWxTD domain-containing protein [Acidobacteriota bacterium]
MSRSSLGRSFIAIFVASIFTVSVNAQTPAATPTDPDKKPIKAKVESNNAFKRWVAEDAGPIITDAEKRAYLALTTDEERENFIQDFWNRRDPTPDTEENEYREAYYERTTYANEHFASGIPGSKTDRGRIYIRWGKPDEVESHPSGGAYDKASYEGGGSATTYPFERWFYRHLDGVGDGIEIEFVDQTGSGEYRLASDLNEKIMIVGPRQQTDAIASYLREQDRPFNVIDRFKNLNSPPPIKYSGLPGTKIETGVLGPNPIGLDLQIGFFSQSDDRVVTTFTVQTNNKDLKFESVGGLETAMLNVVGRLSSVAGRPAGSFEDSVTTSATTDELTSVKDRRSIYQRVVPMSPGIYRADVMVRDVRTGNIGVVKMGFTVPKYDPKKLSTSSLVLATTLRPTDSTEIGNRFVVGNMKLVPNLSGIYKPGQPVGVYMQVYNAGTDETTLRPSVDVEYVVLKDGKQISSTTEDWNGLSDSSQRLTLSRLLPTEGLKPGDYEVKIIAKDRVSGQKVENTAGFTVAK